MQSTTRPPGCLAAQLSGAPVAYPLICPSASPPSHLVALLLGCLAAWLLGCLSTQAPGCLMPANWLSSACPPGRWATRMACWSHWPIFPHSPLRRKGNRALPRPQENSGRGPFPTRTNHGLLNWCSTWDHLRLSLQNVKPVTRHSRPPDHSSIWPRDCSGCPTAQLLASMAARLLGCLVS